MLVGRNDTRGSSVRRGKALNLTRSRKKKSLVMGSADGVSLQFRGCLLSVPPVYVFWFSSGFPVVKIQVVC